MRFRIQIRLLLSGVALGLTLNNVLAEEYSIIFSASVQGETEPCGWRTHRLGGLARKATFIKQYQNANNNILILDAGDLFFHGRGLSPIERDIRLHTAKTTLNSYNLIGYQAYNVAAQDFISGLDFIREIQKTAKFPFISANIADSATNQLLFQPYIIHKIGKKRFGIVGVTTEYQIPIPGVKILPIDEILKKITKELRKNTDYIILLAYLDRRYENEFFAKNYGVDFVLVSGSYRYSRDLEDRNNMLIARCGNIGKYLGVIKFDLVNDKVILANISGKLSQINYAQRRLESFKDSAGNKSLEEYYTDQPSVLNAINSMKNQVEILSIEIQQAVNPVSYDLIELDANIPDDPTIRAKLDELKKITDKIQNQPFDLH